MITTASQTTRSLLLPRGGPTPCSYRIPWPCAGAAPVIVRGESLHRVWCIHAALQQMQQLEHARVVWPGPDTSDVTAALDEISHIVTQRYEALASWGISRAELAPVILAVEEEEIFANGAGHGNQIRDHLLALAVCGAGVGIQIVLGVSWEQTMLTVEVLNSAQLIDLHTTAAPLAEHRGPWVWHHHDRGLMVASSSGRSTCRICGLVLHRLLQRDGITIHPCCYPDYSYRSHRRSQPAPRALTRVENRG